jgi:hypothetical protein
VEIVENEVYKVRNKRQRGGKLPVASHDIAHHESHGYGYCPPGDGLSQGSPLGDHSKLLGNQLGNLVGV